MQKVKLYGEIKEGCLKLDRLGLFETYLRSLPEGQRVEINIQKESQDTTLSQWSYFFACIVTPLSESTGYTKEEIDGIICKKFLTQNPGTDREYVKSKTKCNRAETAILIDQAANFAAELGVVVCPPDKMWRLEK